VEIGSRIDVRIVTGDVHRDALEGSGEDQASKAPVALEISGEVPG
jgi:hypothetical protein